MIRGKRNPYRYRLCRKVYLYEISRVGTSWRYYGITTQKPQNRWKNHLRKSHNVVLRRSIAKYGTAAFQFSVIRTCRSWENACKAECAAIAKARKNGLRLYNMSDGGEGRLGNSGWTPERRAAVAERMRGNKWGLGRKLSPDHAEKLRLAAIAANLGKPKSLEHHATRIAGVIRARKGKPMDPLVVARAAATRRRNRELRGAVSAN